MVGVARSIAFDDSAVASAPERVARLSALAAAHFAYVWRLLRRLGLSDADADDVAQQAFLVASRRLDDILPGSERAFLYKAAVHSAYKHRRAQQRRGEEELDDLALNAAAEPGLEELIDRRRAREILDAIVGTMSLELRVVFVLYEIDGLQTTEIAEVVGIPLGTVASRLRRARADFESRVARFEVRRKSPGAKP
ncbi:MAG TPA: RNA polymerase sigma factor [Polyangiaceae bacterium]|nr:RNA polymerase sigma factor [Polyangiaceae bacterium]